eukprot:gene16225-34007_t
MPTPAPTPSVALRCISSMATRLLLTELAADFTARTGQAVVIESVGGVDAAKRVQAGEVFDAVFLASDAIAKLLAAGHLLSGSQVDLVHSGVAVAVQAGAVAPNISSEDAVRAAVLAAPTLSYSTGPSGVALAQLFARWGIADEIQSRIVQAPPGVPVASLVARGEVELGFQQLSELLGVAGIAIAGPLPPAIQITTIFSAGIPVQTAHTDSLSTMVDPMTDTPQADATRRTRMETA